MSSDCGSSAWSSDELPSEVKYPFIPRSYRVIERLGEGSSGRVYRCIKPGTNEEVAIKTTKDPKYTLKREAKIMRTLMSKKLDKANIVKYHGELYVDHQLSLEFEALDESLEDTIFREDRFMTLDEIRIVVRQLAVALDGLKRVGVIHADLKLDNIMLVDEIKHPLKVKLIDFDVAIFTNKAKIGSVLQVLEFRAPEILFGLPFSEAIDIWSLAVVMGAMLIWEFIFYGHNEHKTVQSIIKLLGPPPKHLLDAGLRTQKFFKKKGDSWKLKTRNVNFQEEPHHERRHKLTSLDDLVMQRQVMDDDSEELRDCVNLLKAMLQWDATKRITPDGILNHPFITRSCANNSSPSSLRPEGSQPPLGTNYSEAPECLKPPSSVSCFRSPEYLNVLSSISCSLSPDSLIVPSPISCSSTPDGFKPRSSIRCPRTTESLNVPSPVSCSKTPDKLKPPSSVSCLKTPESLNVPSPVSCSLTPDRLQPASVSCSKTPQCLKPPSSVSCSRSQECLKPLSPVSCSKTPDGLKPRSSIRCSRTPESLNVPSSVSCLKTPESLNVPSPVSCSLTPDRLQPASVSCSKTPQCLKPPSSVSCSRSQECLKPLSPVSCSLTPDRLKPTSVSCSQTPQCLKPPSSVSCLKTPEILNVPSPVSCSLTPDALKPPLPISCYKCAEFVKPPSLNSCSGTPQRNKTSRSPEVPKCSTHSMCPDCQQDVTITSCIVVPYCPETTSKLKPSNLVPVAKKPKNKKVKTKRKAKSQMKAKPKKMYKKTKTIVKKSKKMEKHKKMEKPNKMEEKPKEMEEKPPKKKPQNKMSFHPFFSWIRKTFTCCVAESKVP